MIAGANDCVGCSAWRAIAGDIKTLAVIADDVPSDLFADAGHCGDMLVELNLLDGPPLVGAHRHHLEGSRSANHSAIVQMPDSKTVGLQRRFLGGPDAEKRRPVAATDETPFVLRRHFVEQVGFSRCDVLDVNSHRAISHHGCDPRSLVRNGPMKSAVGQWDSLFALAPSVPRRAAEFGAFFQRLAGATTLLFETPRTSRQSALRDPQ